jgi:hypothetical protein
MIKVFEEFKRKKEEIPDPLTNLSKIEMFKRFVNRYRFSNPTWGGIREFNDLSVKIDGDKIFLKSEAGFRPEGWEPYDEYGIYLPNWGENARIGVTSRIKKMIDEFNKSGTGIYMAKFNEDDYSVKIYDKDEIEDYKNREAQLRNQMKDIDPLGEEDWTIEHLNELNFNIFNKNFNIFRKRRYEGEVDIKDPNFGNYFNDKGFKPIKEPLNEYLTKTENMVDIDELLKIADRNILLNKIKKYLDRIIITRKNVFFTTRQVRIGNSWRKFKEDKYFDIFLLHYEIINGNVYFVNDRENIFILDVDDVVNMYVTGRVTIPKPRISEIDPLGEEDWDDTNESLEIKDFKVGDVVRHKESRHIGKIQRIEPTFKFPIFIRIKPPGSMFFMSQYCDPNDLEIYEPKQIFSENDPLGEEDWDE